MIITRAKAITAITTENQKEYCIIFDTAIGIDIRIRKTKTIIFISSSILLDITPLNLSPLSIFPTAIYTAVTMTIAINI